MPKHTFIDTILKRPSQSYAEPPPSSSAKSGSNRAGWSAPPDLPNAPGRPQSILSGSMFKSGGAGGKGGLGQTGGGASNAPSVSGMSTTSRFSRFRKKDRRPSISNGSVFNDGASSIAPYAESNATYSPKKGRWWEAGSLKLGRSASRAPSVAGSVFSEPEAPPAMPSFAGIGSSVAPPRGTRSDYGDAYTRSRFNSARSAPPPLPSLPSGVSVSNMRTPSGVAPLGQQPPSLIRQGSRSSLGRGSAAPVDPAARPTSPVGSIGRIGRTKSTTGSQDWKSFVDSMAGTEVAKTWDSMPKLAPASPAGTTAKSQARVEKRKSVVARVQKELNQDAQYEQLQRDPGVGRQDLLARAASQVIGEPPPLPPNMPTNLQPGELVSPALSHRLSSEFASPPRSPVVATAASPPLGYVAAAPIPLAVPAVRAVPAPIEDYTAAPFPAAAPSSTQAQTAFAPPVPGASNGLEAESESEPETEESSSDEDEILANQTLDVVAEEDEETSSNGHNRNHEMKNLQSVRGKSTTRRYTEYDAVLRHHRSGSNMTQEVELPSTDITPSIAISRARSPSPDASSAASESQAESPLFKQPGPEPELTLSSLPPAAAAIIKDDKDDKTAKVEQLRVESDSESDAEEDAPLPPAKDGGIAMPQTTEKPSERVRDENEPSDADLATNSLGLVAARPPMVTRQSSASDYRSAKSGRSTPTAKGVTFDGSDEDDEPNEATEVGADDGAAADISNKDGEDDAGSDSASSAARSMSSQRPLSVRSSRSSRPGTLSRRLSDISLGTTFALSGIVGGRSRPSSRRIKMGDDDSDSPADLSDDDGDLKARAMAEQERLRTMKVGDDFFGPSLTGLLDRFDRMNWSDTTVNRLGSDGRAASIRRSDNASIRSKKIAEAQDTINEVRQRRAETGQEEDGKTRASSAGGLAPSFAAVWLLNQTDEVDPDAAASKAKVDDPPAAGGSSMPASTSLHAIPKYPESSASKYASLFAASDPPKPEVSVLNRPRQKRPARPDEMGGLKISEGKLYPEAPAPPPEDTRSTLPASLSSSSSIYSSATTRPPQAEQTKPSVVVAGGVASKDKPPPAKSAMKNLRHSKSLADTLFSLPLRSPEAKAEKAERKREKEREKSRRASISSERSTTFSLGGKSKSKRDSKDKSRKSVDSQPRSSMASERSHDTASDMRSNASVDMSAAGPGVPAEVSSPEGVSSGVADAEVAVLSEKALGKRPQRDTDVEPAAPRADGTEVKKSVPDAGVRASESVANFETPDQSMADISQASTAVSPPQKFHTAKDLAAMARVDSPEPELPSPSDAQRRLSMQMKAMDGFSSFSLSGFSVQPDEFKKDSQIDAAVETGGDIVGKKVAPGAGEADDAGLAPASEVPHIEVDESVASDSQDDVGAVAVSSSEVSTPSTAQTTPAGSELITKHDRDGSRGEDGGLSGLDRHLPMPPRPTPADVVHLANDDKTPTGNPPRLGINLIPPTPPAADNRMSFVGAQAPTTPTILEDDPMEAQPRRPALISRSSSQKAASRASAEGGKSGQGAADSLTRSKSVATKKKQQWQEYHGKGLSLPPGLIATKVASSADRKGNHALPPLDIPMAGSSRSESPRKPSKKRASALQTMPAASATRDVLPAIPEPEPVMMAAVPAAPVAATPSSKSHSRKHGKSSAVPGAISPSSSMTKIMADAPPVPRIPEAFHSSSPVSSSASRFTPSSEAMSREASSSGASEAGSNSPAPSHVPSQSARSNASWVSSSVHSASVRSSPRPEYSYVNHELSPYARKMRALSPGPSPAPTPMVSEVRRNSLMSAINEWESQVPEDAEARSLSPMPSVTHLPSRFPPLPASTVSRPNSVISAASSPAVVRTAPLGAPTNTYLQPPVARARMSPDDPARVASPEASTTAPFASGVNGSVASFNSSPSASQSVASLPSTMQTVPTSYRPNKDAGRFSGTADELLNTRTTMQTIAVSSGAFLNRSKSVARRKQQGGEAGSDKRTSLDVPEHLQDELSQTTLSLTAHTPPPRKVSSTQVLVQVIAVAIDEMDRLLLRERVRSEHAFGFVPGRSFCGRVVECGYEVKKMRKGDIVFGLQDSRKSGALAEFMTIDANLVCHAPKDCLTTEQIAALPSAGVTAFQILHNHCAQLPRGARVLILNAHDAIGLLTMQEAVGLGLIIVAQCPPSVSDGVAVCQANGAHEVVVGEPLWAINSLHESSFDLVVDTIGGRRIYDASRRILAFEGQFTTCFGDEHTTANPNLKSHLRSLRRAFFKKDKKNLGYEWVGADSGEDCRQALEAVKLAAEKGDICPRLRSVLPFGDAPRAFDPNPSRSLDDEPGAIVVRVS
ncbi:uncharacterized protein PFL1_04176 [Pseudozyma flocculosa PF-1]|uniref:Enoyl reductase (ER) domain-containing protein n=1 Tax=Pseudozyma flocculosa PF-1 TaxID=1277687 RepID=A0A061H7A5_9BASI|nr:uncharacterized protein PFL1_04176 [Pseudozyma flocculosa PF-1]EPQ28349.1 hypothetical protein PFL1_04176 [Pseudozyma flocculosa PF-1]